MRGSILSWKYLRAMKKGRYKTNFMKKLKRKSVGHGPISQKVISALRKTINRKVIDISEWKKAKIHADNLEKSVITDKDLSELDPLHGVYAYAQNKLSVFVEQLD